MPRIRNQIFHCARGKNFAWSSMSGYARPDVHCARCSLISRP
jgi:hypothetical protein